MRRSGAVIAVSPVAIGVLTTRVRIREGLRGPTRSDLQVSGLREKRGRVQGRGQRQVL
jgi:hypothetical protein